MDTLICPPYDVISAQHERELLARSPHNIVRLELAELRSGSTPASRYTDAASAYASMLADGVLRRDDAPAYYVLRQRFTKRGARRERVGLLGALRLEELGTGVLPHEDTAAGPKVDRLALMKATAANFSPLMMLYRDDSGSVAGALSSAMASAPSVDVEVDGEELALWPVSDPAAIGVVRDALAANPVYIADGHHRYETALVYRDLRASLDEASIFVLTCLIAFDDPGLLIQPYYRVVHDLSETQISHLRELLAKLFVSKPAGESAAGPAGLDAAVAAAAEGRVVLGLVEAGEPPALLSAADGSVPSPDAAAPPADQARAVEALVLQDLLLRPVVGDAFPDHVAYVHDPAEAMAMVERGEGQMAFFIKGVPTDVFETVVGAGIRLPRKSTYFHPKLPSGIVINPLDGDL
jgi:uncharacterized protein (DUF1015 family)